jgi:PAS domain S-box-containing protein
MNEKRIFRTKEQLIHKNAELERLLKNLKEELKAFRENDSELAAGKCRGRDKICSSLSGEISFRDFVEEMSAGAAVISKEGTVLFCNRQFGSLLNIDENSIIGRSADEFVFPEDRPRFHRFLNEGNDEERRDSIRFVRVGSPSPPWLYLTTCPHQPGERREVVCLIASDLSGAYVSDEETRQIRATYEKQIVEMTAALKKANEEVVHSRLASLNIMDDVAGAFRGLKISNEQLARENKRRRKARKKLKKSEKRFRILLNASPEAILKMGLDSTIEDLSDVAPDIFGFEKKKELRGKLFLELVQPGDRNRIQEMFGESHTRGTIRDVEITLKKKDGSTFLAEISLTLIEKKSGTPVAFVAIIRDVSMKKRLDLQLINNARLASLGEMATGLAHEINQPLNTISLTLDNFLYEINRIESIDKSYFNTKSEKIFNNIYRIKNIIEHIRDFSRYQDDRSLVAFDLHKSITNAISLISEEFRFKEIELVTDFEKSGCYVLGNVFKFEQVILNLLSNARDALDEKKKASPETTGSYVKIHTFTKNKFVYVAVEDNGTGIKPEDIDKVLLPFYSTKEVGKGTGLGLSVSYGIIKEMNGTFEIQSKPDVGTTMLIRLSQEEREPGLIDEGE